jgi:RNA polymerase sigma factor for flagellar operon FliA
MARRPSAKERQKLVDANVPFVRALAAKLREGLPGNVDYEDLVSYGMQGLLEAAQRFDGRHGASFTTFAYYRIRGAIYDGMRGMGFVPRAELTRQRVEERAAAYLAHLAEREYGAEEPAPKALDLEEEVRYLAEALGDVAAIFLASLDAGGGLPAALQPTQHLERRERNRALQAALATLPEKERKLLELYYYEDLNLDEAGAKLGLSKSWASRVHARAIVMLRKALSKRPEE